MPKLCEMEGVRGGEPDFPVELWRDDRTGRLVVRATNEGGFACIDIDLGDLWSWFGGQLDEAAVATAIGKHSERGPSSV